MSNKKLLSATSLSVLLMATASNVTPAYADLGPLGPLVYTNANNGQTEDTTTISGRTSNTSKANGLKIVDVDTLTFNNNLIINANYNDISGLSINDSTSILFEGAITASKNKSTGIFISDSTVTFEGAVTATDNGFGAPVIPGRCIKASNATHKDLYY